MKKKKKKKEKKNKEKTKKEKERYATPHSLSYGQGKTVQEEVFSGKEDEAEGWCRFSD